MCIPYATAEERKVEKTKTLSEHAGGMARRNCRSPRNLYQRDGAARGPSTTGCGGVTLSEFCGHGGIERVERAQLCVGPLAIAQHHISMGEPEAGGGNLGAQGHGAAERVGRLDRLALAEQRLAEKAPRVGIVGPDAHGFLKEDQGLGRAAGDSQLGAPPPKRQRQIARKIGELRLLPVRLAQQADGVLVPALAAVDGAEIGLGSGERGLQSQRLAELPLGLAVALLEHERRAEIIVSGRAAGAQRQGSVVFGLGVTILLALEQRAAQVVVTDHAIGVERERAAPQRLGIPPWLGL